MRDYSLDYIRAAAIFAIVVCHFLIFCTDDVGIGRLLAGGGNILFFLLSAFLYGQKWEKSRYKSISPIPFLKRRILKLGASLWPFLICLLILYVLIGVEFSVVAAVLNFLFLGAFAKLPGNGHLWFLTVMMMCYGLFVLLSWRRFGNWALSIMGLVCFALYLVLECNGLPGNFMLIIGLSGFVFSRSGIVFRIVDKICKSLLTLIFIGISILGILLFEHGLFESNRIIAYLVLDLFGIIAFLFLLKIVPSTSNVIIGFISSISYELYLVHHTFCAVPAVSVKNWSEYGIIQLLLLFGISTTIAYFLHAVAERIQGWKFLK